MYRQIYNFIYIDIHAMSINLNVNIQNNLHTQKYYKIRIQYTRIFFTDLK
jgi:hypothetical protein